MILLLRRTTVWVSRRIAPRLMRSSNLGPPCQPRHADRALDAARTDGCTPAGWTGAQNVLEKWRERKARQA